MRGGAAGLSCCMSKQSNAAKPPIDVSGASRPAQPSPQPLPEKKHRKTEPEVTIAPTAPGGPDVTIS